MRSGRCTDPHTLGRNPPRICKTVSKMADKATLKLILEDIGSIKCQIDILRMEARAHQLETLAHLLDLAYQEAMKSELPGSELDDSLFRPFVLQ